MMRICLLLCLCCLPSWLWAQYIFGFQQEYFFGHLPSPRTEALGRADVAVGGSVTSMFYNPAGIGSIEDWEAIASTSAPFYVLRESDYYFLGGAKRIHPKVVVAATAHQFSVGPTTFDININGEKYPLNKARTTNLALTAAANPIKNLQAGINLNFFDFRFIKGVASAKTFHFDGGVLYTIPLPQAKEGNSGNLRFGAGLTNFTFTRVTYASPLGDETSNQLPAVLRIGAAFEQELQIPLPTVENAPLGLLFTIEYQNVLNSDYRSGIRIGGEATLLKIFAFRLGFFQHSLNDFGNSVNYSRLRDLTHGFGFIIPVAQLSQGNLPFDLHIDFTSMKQPPTSSLGSRIPNMRAFGLRLVSSLPSNPKSN